MKNAIILIIVAIITLTAVFAIYRPDILEDTWLWIIGLIGPIIALLKETIRLISGFMNSLKKTIKTEK